VPASGEFGSQETVLANISASVRLDCWEAIGIDARQIRKSAILPFRRTEPLIHQSREILV
jgi:hypothetical protein